MTGAKDRKGNRHGDVRSGLEKGARAALRGICGVPRGGTLWIARLVKPLPEASLGRELAVRTSTTHTLPTEVAWTLFGAIYGLERKSLAVPVTSGYVRYASVGVNPRFPQSRRSPRRKAVAMEPTQLSVGNRVHDLEFEADPVEQRRAGSGRKRRVVTTPAPAQPMPLDIEGDPGD